MAIEKAKPLGSPKMDKELADKRIANARQQIQYYKEEIELHKKALEIQLKNPKVLKPNFGFEETEEWAECLKEQWKFNNRRQIEGLQFSIEETTERILEWEQMSKEE